MSIEGQGHFFTIYLPGFVCFVLYLAKISGERLQDHWSSGSIMYFRHLVSDEGFQRDEAKTYTYNKPKVDSNINSRKIVFEIYFLFLL